VSGHNISHTPGDLHGVLELPLELIPKYFEPEALSGVAPIGRQNPAIVGESAPQQVLDRIDQYGSAVARST
jgi:hypothetical protein